MCMIKMFILSLVWSNIMVNLVLAIDVIIRGAAEVRIHYHEGNYTPDVATTESSTTVTQIVTTSSVTTESSTTVTQIVTTSSVTTTSGDLVIPTAAIIPTIWAPFIEDPLGYYFQITNKVEWGRAMHRCNETNHTLIYITSQSEQDALDQAIQRQDLVAFDFWTDGIRSTDTSSFIWQSIMQPFNYTNWGTNQPSADSKQQCVGLYDQNHNVTSKWHNAECDYLKGFVCI